MDNIKLKRVDIRFYNGEPLATVRVEAIGENILSCNVIEIKRLGTLRDTLAIRYMNPEIVKAFWDEAERVSREHKNKIRF